MASSEDTGRTKDSEQHVEDADRANGEPGATAESGSSRPSTPPAGKDTATGTDPDATYEQPGYEDKSFGQAVDQDQELVDDLVEESGGDTDEAERRFEERSAGRNAKKHA